MQQKNKNNNIFLKGILAIAFLLFFNCTFSQVDTLNKKNDSLRFHSPKKAALFSAIVPGLGQAYNKKYWKIALIYVAAGALTYYAIDNNKEYQKFRTAYNLRTDNDSTTIDQFAKIYPDYVLLDEVDRWRRYRDLNIVGLVLVYVLNIVDANVDAHLFDFNINNDLSLRVEPYYRKQIFSTNNTIGFSCSLNF